MKPTAKSKYGYLYNTKQWRAIRSEFLQLHPLCVMCEKDGMIVKADVVDHIERHKGDLKKFFGGPFQSLCYTHHDSTKQRMELYGVIIGGDESGNPIDPAHHWNKTKG